MTIKELGTNLDENYRNDLNNNFRELSGFAESATNALNKANSAEQKANSALQQSATAGQNADNAKQIAQEAKTTSENANTTSESVQEQINQITIEGSIDPETKQARVDGKGIPYNTLKERLDKEIGALSNQNTGNIDSRKLSKGMVTFHYDDGYPVHYSKVYKSIHLVKNVPLVIALDIWRVLKNTSGKVTYSQVREMYDSGLAEIASHSMTHIQMDDSQTVSQERMEWEVVESLKLLQRMGFDISTWVTPVSTYSTDLQKVQLLKDNYSAAYTVFKNGVVGTPASLNMTSNVNIYGMWRARLDCGLTKAKQFIDYAEANNTWITFYAHDVSATGDMTEEDLTLLVDYALSKNVDIVTTKEAVSRFSTVMLRKQRPELLPQSVRALEGQGNENLLKNACFKVQFGKNIPNGWSFTSVNYTGTWGTNVTQGFRENEFNVTFNGNNTGIDESGILVQDYSISNLTEPLVINLSSKAKLTGNNMRYKMKIAPKYADGTQKYTVEKEFEVIGEYKKFDISAVIPVDPLINRVTVALYPINKAIGNQATISIKQPKLEVGFTSSEWLDGKNTVEKDYARTTLTNSSLIPVPEATFTLLQFNSAPENVNSCYNTSTGLFTASYTGLYNISAGLAYEDFTNVGARLLLTLNVNGNRILHNTNDSSGPDTGLSLSTHIKLNAGDTVSLECWWRRKTGDATTGDPKKIKINPYTWATFCQL